MKKNYHILKLFIIIIEYLKNIIFKIISSKMNTNKYNNF